MAVRIFSPTAGTQMWETTDTGSESALPDRVLHNMLWYYYLSNGLYDQLRNAGHYLQDARLKGLRNPAFRCVEFYPAVIMPGALPDALPLAVNGDLSILPAIQQLWQWSNWSRMKQALVRKTAITGNAYIKVTQPLDKMTEEGLPIGKPRLFLDVLDSRMVSEHDTDERSFTTYCRIDVPQSTRESDKLVSFIHTEVWSKETVRVWRHKKAIDTELGKLGDPILEIPLSAWGINFVPIVHVQHIDIGEDAGLGAFLPALDKIDEANRQASRLHQLIYRHDQPVWAIRANAEGPTGRPLPAPNIGNIRRGTATSLEEFGDDQLLRLPGHSELQALVPQLDYQAHLDSLADMVAEIERDLPEAQYWALKDLPEMSGKALRLVMTPALNRAKEVRGNHETALIRAQEMALTIGQNTGVWEAAGIAVKGTWEKGDFEHDFTPRDLLPLSRQEQAELITAEVQAGIPLKTALRRVGWGEEEISLMEEEKQDEATAQQAGLGAALMEAQARFNGGDPNAAL